MFCSLRAWMDRALQFVEPSFHEMQLFGGSLLLAADNHEEALAIGRHVKYSVIRKKTYDTWTEWDDGARSRRFKTRLGGNRCAEDLTTICVKEFPAISCPNRTKPPGRGNPPLAAGA